MFRQKHFIKMYALPTIYFDSHAKRSKIKWHVMNLCTKSRPRITVSFTHSLPLFAELAGEVIIIALYRDCYYTLIDLPLQDYTMKMNYLHIKPTHPCAPSQPHPSVHYRMIEDKQLSIQTRILKRNHIIKYNLSTLTINSALSLI